MLSLVVKSIGPPQEPPKFSLWPRDTGGHDSTKASSLTLSPVRVVKLPRIDVSGDRQHGKRYRSRHHYLVRANKDESLRLRRLGSGLLNRNAIDSSLLTHLVVGNSHQMQLFKSMNNFPLSALTLLLKVISANLFLTLKRLEE